MRTYTKWTIGAALILVAASGAYTGYRSQEGKAEFSWVPARDGRLHFALLLDSKAWAYVTEHKGLGWTDELLDAKVHAQVNALVEEGMRGERQRCPGRWLMRTIRELPDGSMYFSGFCANPAELEQFDSDQYAKVRT